MSPEDTNGMKLFAGGKEVTKEQVEEAISAYEKKIASPEYQKELEEFAEFLSGKAAALKEKKAAAAKKRIEYYEFPNSTVVKAVHGDHVYRFDRQKKAWEIDHSLTAEFAWDRAYGEPVENLRSKVDLTEDLPAFPAEEAFFRGNTILFGAYPQKSAYDYSPIEWIVLDVKGNTALCITKDALIRSGYCDPKKAYGKPEQLWWENSLAREVLNDHFLEAAFSEEEKKKLIPKTMTETHFGKTCTDSVFLLSEREAREYFPTDEERRAIPTPYAKMKGAALGWGLVHDCTSWWILPQEHPEMTHGEIYAKAVFYSGGIQFHGRNIGHIDFTLRPCIQIQYKND
ncbi:MAG: hypothetical protein E7332_02725 [Clostridiales bacterium]|nr:hypothetical protein [Clostridiales bacterium]